MLTLVTAESGVVRLFVALGARIWFFLLSFRCSIVYFYCASSRAVLVIGRLSCAIHTYIHIRTIAYIEPSDYAS